jgi:hypothetical protein
MLLLLFPELDGRKPEPYLRPADAHYRATELDERQGTRADRVPHRLLVGLPPLGELLDGQQGHQAATAVEVARIMESSTGIRCSRDVTSRFTA